MLSIIPIEALNSMSAIINIIGNERYEASMSS
jgi:hypothetical protein